LLSTSLQKVEEFKPWELSLILKSQRQKENWIAENLQERNSVRESDLKNHLTATIETEEEKIKRIEMEKQDRIERVKRVEAIREKKKQDANESEERPTRYTAEEDYQVRQAVRFLKSYDLIRELATP